MNSEARPANGEKAGRALLLSHHGRNPSSSTTLGHPPTRRGLEPATGESSATGGRPTGRRCVATTRAGLPCRAWTIADGNRCYAHHDCAQYTDPGLPMLGRWIGPRDFIGMSMCAVCGSLQRLVYLDPEAAVRGPR